VLAWNNSALFLGISLGALIGGQAMTRAGFALTTELGAAIAGAAAVWVALIRHASTIAKTPTNSITTNG
jgi:predicted MFS family arabinose efflux permease